MAEESTSEATCVMGDAASAEAVKHRATKLARFRSAAVRMVPIWFAAAFGLALAQWVVDGRVEWGEIAGGAAGGLLGIAAIVAASALLERLVVEDRGQQ